MNTSHCKRSNDCGYVATTVIQPIKEEYWKKMQILLTVDRIEEGQAVLSDTNEKMYCFPCSCFPFPLTDGLTLLVTLTDDAQNILTAGNFRKFRDTKKHQKTDEKAFFIEWLF